jgi:lysophospholipase L1-like esterase
MRTIPLLALLILISASMLRADGEAKPLVILLGDSIRMNYQAGVVEALKGKAEVWAPKENGRDTTFTLESLDGWLADRTPAVVHLNVGLHDLFLDGKTGRPRHNVEIYEKNLRAILTRLKQRPHARIIFALTTKVNEAWQAASQTYGRVVRRNRDIDVYNTRAREIALDLGVAVNDLPAFMKAAGPDHILRPSDGIHLSPDGCRLMGQEVATRILEALAMPNNGR